MRGQVWERDFPTSLLEAHRDSLFRKLSAEECGGLNFVRLALLADAVSAGGSEEDQSSLSSSSAAAEAAQEVAWEQLHSGPWHAVPIVWRDAYSFTSLLIAKQQVAAGDRQGAMRNLDLGIMMGGPLLRQDLESAISFIRTTASNSCSDSLDYENSFRGDRNESGGRAGIRGSEEEKSSAMTEAVLQGLPARSLCCKLLQRRNSLSLEGFLCDFFLPGVPVIINGAIDWPALTKWQDVSYLQSVAGDRTVPVEVGSNYLAPEWKQEMITFSHFLERIRQDGPTTYLAQHPLFDQITDLRKDISVPDYITATGGILKSLNAWFGPSGTVTPLHHDPHHNLFVQVYGKKYLRLYHASITNQLYPYEESMLSNSSMVDLDKPDPVMFPEAQDLEFMDCVLEEGEMLYIPPKWWHYVRSLTTSFSVSFWWGDSCTDDSDPDEKIVK